MYVNFLLDSVLSDLAHPPVCGPGPEGARTSPGRHLLLVAGGRVELGRREAGRGLLAALVRDHQAGLLTPSR